MYFTLKERVFSASRLGVAYSTESLESLIKEEFGTEAVMSDVRHPRFL